VISNADYIMIFCTKTC